MSFIPRKNVTQIRPYIPGKPVKEVMRELGITSEVIKLASNENPLGPSKHSLEVLRKGMYEINFYPEDGAYYLTKALAEHIGVAENQIILGNGSVELIGLIALALVNPGESVVMSDQAFILYRIVTQIVDGRRITVPMKNYTHDLDAMANAIEEDTKVVYIANPNNPTGTMVTQDEVTRFMKKVPEHVVVVFDEAYYEYITRPDYPDTLQYVKQGRNVIILRTFSKVYGLAGLRVGYGIAKKQLIETVRKVRLPFNVNSLAQEAAVAALNDGEHIRISRQVNEEGKIFLHIQFDQMGLFHTPSVANFVFLDVGVDSNKIYEGLQRQGVIVRPIKEYDFPTAFRITVGTEPQNKKLIAALKKVLVSQ